MKKEQKQYLAIGLLIAIILYVAFVVLPGKENEEIISSEGEDITLGLGTTTIDGGTVNIIDPETGGQISVPAPSLDRPIVIPDSFGAEGKETWTTKIEKATKQVRNNPDSFTEWIELGNLRQSVQDYEGAAEIYEYLAQLYTSSIPNTNLGNIYQYHLKDFPRAEANYKEAVARSSGNETIYIELHTLYRYNYKTDTTLAATTLLEGLEKVPTSIGMRVELAQYYEEQGNMTLYRTYLEAARDEAQRQELYDVASDLQKDIDAI